MTARSRVATLWASCMTGRHWTLRRILRQAGDRAVGRRSAVLRCIRRAGRLAWTGALSEPW